MGHKYHYSRTRHKDPPGRRKRKANPFIYRYGSIQNALGYQEAKESLKYFPKPKKKVKLDTNTQSTEYELYLKSDHWQALRTKKLAEAEYRCQLCYSPDQLNIHHRTYERKGNEKLSDLTVLCRKCHKKFHNIKEM